MSSKTSKRKIEHIEAIENDSESDRQQFYFDEVRLIHRALPEISLNEVDTSIKFLAKELSFPMIISGMTGGIDEEIISINQNLAKAVEEKRIGMSVGSQRVMFLDKEAKKSFDLRKFAPNALLFANLGAVQLNYDFGIDNCKEAVDILEADALYLHLNPLQEAIQPEGDTNFKDLASKIGKVVKELSVPVIIKEVGAGISVSDAKLLVDKGVKYIDVAGSGGTSWSRVENHRRDLDDLGLLFQDWGIPTPQAIDDIANLGLDVELVASGGVRSGLDIAKAMVLGASLGAMAKPFLAPARISSDEVVKEISRIHTEFKTSMFLLGCSSVDELTSNLLA